MGRNKKLSFKMNREKGVLIVLILLTVFFSLTAERFFSKAVFLDVLDRASVNTCLALGMCFVIITGGIDLSVGTVLCLVAVSCGKLANANVPSAVVYLVGLIGGMVFGLANGLLVAKLKLQPFIATLGTSSVLRGLCYIITKGWPVTNISKDFRMLMNYNIADSGLKMYVVVIVVVTLLCAFVLSKTKFGTYVYASGSNDEASRLSGINVDFIRITAYTICGLLAALGGLVYISRLSSADASLGSGMELDAIAAVAIGGCSMAGGTGKIHGVAMGALILAVLGDGLIMIGLNAYAQYIATGVVIIIAASFEFFQKRGALLQRENEVRRNFERSRKQLES